MMSRRNTFHFEHESNLGGEKKTYSGKFTARVASMADNTKINIKTSQILGGYYCCRDDEGQPTGRGVSPEVEFSARMQAHLEICLEQKPEWFAFDGDNAIVDQGLVFALYREVVKYEATFLGRRRPEDPTDSGSAQGSEADGAAQPPKADHHGGPTPVVGREVQAALDA